MADRLSIYKDALSLLGPYELKTLNDNRPERYKLDNAWDSAVAYMLRLGLWNWAIRAVEITHDDDVEPLFGYQYGFRKPDDWVRTAGISYEPTFYQGFEEYQDEQLTWFANCDPLYVRYVSNDIEYGLNIGRWGEAFSLALGAYLAFKTCLSITNGKGNRDDMYALFNRLLSKAKTLDAFDEAVQFAPPGRLVRSRLSRFSRRSGDRY